ncbi:DNA polymerase I [Candidatus Spongiihabitans sp.]|uniref:DNA polymerase I n=1 Tax=Candidatus Spongiihabitans sp. TaxID=3101308 RepID=UPI003C6EC163
MSPDKELILVDGTSFLFRAYHALGRNPLTTSDGRTTQAIFGMVNMLRSLLKECQPTHIAVVMDAKGKTFRHDLYKAYKANRPPMPEDLRQQLAYVNKIIPAMGLPLISISGVEADDVIGTLSIQATTQGFRTMIVSSDKDLTQLVNDQVEMVDTMKNVRLNPAGVSEKFGVPPQRIIEYLALIGDSSDNIPGIPKVGAKTAVKWFDEYGTLDKIIENADKISGKVGEYLRDNLDQLELSKKLTTIKCDVELEQSPNDLTRGNPDYELLRAYYTDLEFRSWLKEIEAQNDDDGHVEERKESDDANSNGLNNRLDNGLDYETIWDTSTLDKWIEKLKKSSIFAIDTETTSLDVHRAELVGMSFAVTPGEAAYLPLGHNYAGVPKQLPLKETLEKLRPILEDPSQAKTGQNLKYDVEVLQNYDIHLQGITHDTMLISYILDAGNSRHDMDTLALKHLGKQTIKFSDVAGSGKNQLTFDQIAIEVATPYAAEDADITLQLHQTLLPKLEKDPKLNKLFNEIEMPLMSALVRTETNGVKIDAAQLKKQSAEIAIRLVKLEKKAYAVAGEPFNIASPKQIQEILYEKQGIPVKRKTPNGQPSTAENVLQELAAEYELPQLILEHRSLAKLKGTYTDKLPELINPKTGRIHTSYHQAVASTGRLSSADPNLQNIPIRSEDGRKIREAFIPEDGNVLIAADYSQIELRIMAHLSGDKGLINAFNNGIDVHSATAAEVFGIAADEVDEEQRRRAKAINFGLIYGMSAFGLARQLKIVQKEARNYIDIYFDRYPGVKQYMEKTKQSAREKGFVETLFGRRLNLPEINSKNAVRRQYAERTAINAPMQGTAADLIKLAMLAIDKWILDNQSSNRIILQVHDELVFEVEKKNVNQMKEISVELMCGVAKLKVPLIVDIGVGANWKEAH